MLTYWALFAFFAIGAYFDSDKEPDFQRRRPMWIIGSVLMLLLVGLRYKVGADWETYDLIFRIAGNTDLDRAMSLGDPGFEALNWLVSQLGGDIYWVNLVCALLFTWGLFRLARVQPYPWLAILVAVPYMVIVIACGYTRQAAALGLIMGGISALIRGGSLVRFAVYVALAATLHRTAVVVLPLAIFSRPHNRIFNVIGGLAIGYAMYDTFLAESMDKLVSHYIDVKYSSQGAAIRIAIEVMAASIFLLRRKAFQFPEHEDKLWFYFSLASFAALAALILTPSSTAIDRLSIYLMPLQLVILSRVPFVYTGRTFGILIVTAFSFAVEFVWLNFATHAQYWVPYQVYPVFGS